MKKKSTIVRHSLSQIKAMRERGEGKTGLDVLEAESLGAHFWSNAHIVMPVAERPPFISGI